MLAKIATYAIDGIEARSVVVEADIRNGLPSFTIVGLPDAAVREARERVRAALLNSGFEFPQRRITVNLAPADRHKAGPAFDLAIATAVLEASGQVERPSGNSRALIGELSLDGGLCRVRGVLAIAEAAVADGVEALLVPAGNAAEGGLVAGVAVHGLRRLADVAHPEEWITPPAEPEQQPPGAGADLADIRGHEFALRAIEVAAAGGHNLLMQGPPGCGKTMLARRIASVLPSMTHDEAVEVTRIHSVVGQHRQDGLIANRPFRAPHHTVSASGLVGGGRVPIPGEVTLATNGVLFLDELAEFAPRALEALRQPLEDATVTVTRGQVTHTFPARFMLIGATNPCPCGFDDHRCRCTFNEVSRYRKRLSGPLLDRFDMVCHVERPSVEEVRGGPVTNSQSVRNRVESVRALQLERYMDLPAVRCNGQLDAAATRRCVKIEAPVREMLVDAYRRGSLSLRGFDRCLRVARTVADLAGSPVVAEEHVGEALGFRVTTREPVAT